VVCCPGYFYLYFQLQESFRKLKRVGLKLKNAVLLLFFLGISIIWFYLKDNRHILNFIFQEHDIRVIIRNLEDKESVLKVPVGSRVRDVLNTIDYKLVYSENPELDRVLSDGDFIDLKKGF